MNSRVINFGWWVRIGLLLAGIGGLALVLVASQRTTDRPNIVFILADDLGHGDLGCYGHPTIRTPHLDRLAKQGMRFTQFYVSAPHCTASRGSFLTGQHAQRFGLYHGDVPEGLPREALPIQATTIAELLQKAGYHTAHFGKWHLGEPPHTGSPRQHGFDWFFGALGGRPSSSWFKYSRYVDAQFWLNEEQPRTYPAYATDVMTDKALEYLTKVGKDSRPFYINIWYNAPHEPLTPKVDQVRLYEKVPGVSEQQKVYFGTVTNMDTNIGRILQKLDALGVANNTLVLFSSDNGPEYPHPNSNLRNHSQGGAGPLRGAKRSLWEGGIRVPLIARWPKRVPAGVTSETVASGLDFIHTACEFAGVEIKHRDRLDEGISLAPILTGQSKNQPRTLLFESRLAQKPSEPPSGTAVIRQGDWKLHVYVMGGYNSRLYDLKRDPGEKKDLSSEHPEIVKRLESKAFEWYETLPKDTRQHRSVPTPGSELEANRLEF